MYGFDSLSRESLEHLIEQYREGLRRIDTGETRYACGGEPRHRIARWLRQAETELNT